MRREERIKSTWVWWLALAAYLVVFVVIVGGFVWQVLHW